MIGTLLGLPLQDSHDYATALLQYQLYLKKKNTEIDHMENKSMNKIYETIVVYDDFFFWLK